MTVKRVIIYLNLEINLYEAFIEIGRKIFLPPFRSYYIYQYEKYLSLSVKKTELQIKKENSLINNFTISKRKVSNGFKYIYIYIMLNQFKPIFLYICNNKY